MKAYADRIMWFVSGCACVLLGMSAYKGGVLLAGVLIIFLIMNIGWISDSFKKTGKRPACTGFTAGMLLFQAGIFYLTWVDSSKLQILASTLRIDKEQLLHVCQVVGVCAAYPFARAFSSWLLAEEDVAQDKCATFLDSKRFFMLCLLFGCVGIAVQLFSAVNSDIWFDEAFTLALVRHSYADIVRYSAMDVHPPLYYILLKAFLDLLRTLGINRPVIELAKMFSVVPYAVLLVFCASKVSKCRGNYVAGLTAVSMVSISRLLESGVEIRMYTWGTLFVTCAYIFLDDVIRNDRFRDWLCFVLCSLAAAYTHYFACIAVAFFYLVLLYRQIREARIKRFLFAAAATFVGYLPWLRVLIAQTSSVYDEYWISPIKLKMLGDYCIYAFENGYVMVLLAGSLLLIIMSVLKKKNTGTGGILAFSGMTMILWVVGVGIAVSWLIRPVFQNRYLRMTLVCVWMGAAIGMSAMRKTRLQAMSICLLAVLGIGNSFDFVSRELERRGYARENLWKFKVQENCVYVASDAYFGAAFAEQTENVCYMLDTKLMERDRWMYPMFGRTMEMEDEREILDLLNEGKQIRYISNNENKTQQLVDRLGLTYKYDGKCYINGMANVYRVEKE